MALTYTKVETRTVTAAGISLVETRTIPYASGVAGATITTCVVEVKANMNSLAQVRTAVANFLANLDELIAL